MKRKVFSLLALFLLVLAQIPTSSSASACTDLEIIFARGSGSALNGTNYQTFYSALNTYLSVSRLSYNFYELGTSKHDGHSYPAAAVGTENFSNFTTALGAVVGGGSSYAYGASVQNGVEELKAYTEEILAKCPNTKFIIAGYSQGAQVVSTSLSSLKPNTIIYVATFGDPKLYLPEGKGIIPSACRGGTLSPYRAYVPDCRAYQGILGGTIPYQSTSYSDGQIGTWCIYHDIMCSAYINLSDPIASHLNYKSDGMYTSAAKVIAKKLAEAFPDKMSNQNDLSDYDVVFLMDTTDSMTAVIDSYKQRAIDLATKVSNAGGRVALYDYRDFKSGRHPIKFCSLEACALSAFTNALDTLNTSGGGDVPESLLASAKEVLNDASWQTGAKKAVVALTNSNFHNPDRDGTTLSEVVSLAKSIDPVHFYVIAPEEYRQEYEPLTSGTGGSFFSLEQEIELSTDIVSNNISKPSTYEKPTTISNLNLTSLSNDSVEISFTTAAARVYVALNDTILGYTTENSLIITELDHTVDNSISLIPYSASGFRGEQSSATIHFVSDDGKNDSQPKEGAETLPNLKAPKTGQL